MILELEELNRTLTFTMHLSEWLSPSHQPVLTFVTCFCFVCFLLSLYCTSGTWVQILISSNEPWTCTFLQYNCAILYLASRKFILHFALCATLCSAIVSVHQCTCFVASSDHLKRDHPFLWLTLDSAAAVGDSAQFRLARWCRKEA